jgi:hypothetical protein
VAKVGDDHLSLEQLIDSGWTFNGTTGVHTPQFTSVSLCLNRNGRQIKCVQGYGPTRAAAQYDAAQQANAWLGRNHVERPERR